MKKVLKKWLLTGAFCTVAGAVVFAGSLSFLKFDFRKLSTEKYREKTYTVTEDFTDIAIIGTTAQIKFCFSENGDCTVFCSEKERLNYSVTAEDGVLKIKENDTRNTRNWFDHIAVSFGQRTLTVNLPKKEYGTLSVQTDTGDLKIPNDFSFRAVKVSGDTSDVDCLASAKEEINIRTSTGDIRLSDLSCQTVKIKTDTGNAVLGNVRAADSFAVETDTGDVRFQNSDAASIKIKTDTGNTVFKNVRAANSFAVKTDAGDVRFQNSDAASITVETDTGDVTGTLLSDKVFLTETDTGNVDVPKTVAGGTCQITTDTGDIKISIARP